MFLLPRGRPSCLLLAKHGDQEMQGGGAVKIKVRVLHVVGYTGSIPKINLDLMSPNVS